MKGFSVISIDVPGDVSVSGALHLPQNEASGVAIALAPGAGSTMENPFVIAIAAGLAERGHLVMRFNFGYHQRGSRRPDPQKKLLATYRAAAEALRSQGAKRLVIGGKSMGGRMASLLAAEGFACDGLVFLGYPLHPPGQPEKMRDAHLTKVSAPMLFVQGTRDKLCDLSLLKPVLAKVGLSAASGQRPPAAAARATLREIAGGDHSFEVRKMDGRTPESVLAEVISTVDEWIRATVT